MLLGPIVAAENPVADVVNEAVIVELLTMVTPEIIRPLAGAVTRTAVPAAVKPLPARVTETAPPRRPEVGAIEVANGVPG
jgi:hypothetical protein